MTQYDLTPLYRSSVGFDRLFQLLDAAGTDANGYPPYNIEKTGEDTYRISMAVAGFTEAELDLESRDGLLTVRGNKEKNGEGSTYLHRGIATRSFERRFQLADHVEVAGASLSNGMLNVDLVRELPERMKPRKIEILNGKSDAKTIEAKAA